MHRGFARSRLQTKLVLLCPRSCLEPPSMGTGLFMGGILSPTRTWPCLQRDFWSFTQDDTHAPGGSRNVSSPLSGVPLWGAGRGSPCPQALGTLGCLMPSSCLLPGLQPQLLIAEQGSTGSLGLDTQVILAVVYLSAGWKRPGVSCS